MKVDGTVKTLLAALVCGVWALAAAIFFANHSAAAATTPATSKASNASFGTLTVRRLNLVGNDGKLLLVLSNRSLMPPPIIHGKAFKRVIQPWGTLFYDRHRSEQGGLTLSRGPGDRRMHALVFDYKTNDGIAMFMNDVRPKAYDAGFLIMDPQPLHAKVGAGGAERVALEDHDGNAALVLSDKNGNPRIRLEVTKTGKAEIEMLNAKGKIVYRLPRSSPARRG